MEAALFGILSALSLGTADFTARFTSRAFGVGRALLFSLALECGLLTLWASASGLRLETSWIASPAMLLYGASSTVMTLLLFWGLSRGPVSVVAPIVGAHPVLVVLLRTVTGGTISMPQALAGMVTLTGTALVGIFSRDHQSREASGNPALSGSIAIATLASFAYVAMVLSGQSAKHEFGALETLWAGKLVSLCCLLLTPVWFRAAGPGPRPNRRWFLLLALQGAMGAAGYLFLFEGSRAEGPPVVIVLSSTFAAVTVILARFVIRERISPLQWAGVAMVTLGTAWLTWQSTI
ncbi:DMT family transporter [Aerococcus loyolae]|uniref:EamA domain-containing protein n=1 Tax=Aerococcus urinae TaxID=1376 RepID=A0A329NZ27_9LACT|nr:DMT family transporter [Aerococcus loyolae]RAV76562.1 hypothetical protein DBT54_09770 [Aerococcus loyolae]